MKKIKLPFKLLTYDIETKLKEFLGFSLGEQVVRHTQMTTRSIMQHNIICIAAKWYDEDKVMLFKGENAVEEFDKQARKADVCMGKNNRKFDVKYINTERMLRGLPPYPEWMNSSEDLESQMRKYFYFPSQSLDYISTLFGMGGKVKMDWSDWEDIHYYEKLLEFKDCFTLPDKHYLESFCSVEFKDTYRNIVKNGKAALKKMYFYNKKDVLDTEAALVKVLPYIQLRHNAGNETKGVLACKLCGSGSIVPTKKVVAGSTKYQEFYCSNHNGYAGRATFTWDKHRHEKFGKIS